MDEARTAIIAYLVRAALAGAVDRARGTVGMEQLRA
jgi:hypothetical protein